MKNILLASVSAFAFAGAAAADVTFGGDAELGYNDVIEDGFYWDANLTATLTQELNNGLTAGASITINLADGDLGNLGAEDYVLWLTSENAGLYFGTTDTAAGKHWAGVDGMEADGFTTDPNDALLSGTVTPLDGGPVTDEVPVYLGHNVAVLRGDISYGGIDASVSYLVANDGSPAPGPYADDLEQLSVGAAGSFGNFNVSLAYQDAINITAGGTSVISDGDFSVDRIFGISVGTTFGGADVMLAYAKNSTEDITSTAIGGSYPVGPVTVGAYFSNNTGAGAVDGNTWGITADYASGPITAGVWYEDYQNADADWGIDATYDVGNGLTVLAGVDDAGDSHYFGAEFDMGSGATLGLSYSNADEIGAPEYKEGTTAWVSFTF